MSTGAAVSCRELVKTYAGRPPVEAVRGLDLEVGVGECFGVLGPNGAGKTTTIEILEGLLDATSGEVEVLGRCWNRDADALRERIGISLQETRLADKLSVLETLKLFRSFYKKGISAEDALAQVSLQDKAKTWVKNLSGGQRQRLAVATALVGDPELMFLDEPTTGLDPQSRRQLWEIIRSFALRGRTVLLTTHYMDEAERLCDRVAIVDHGKVIACGTPKELIAKVGGDHIVEFRVEGHAFDRDDEQVFGDWPTVTSVQFDEGLARLTLTSVHLVVPSLMQWVQDRQGTLESLATRHASLEDVFVALTGRSLDDAD